VEVRAWIEEAQRLGVALDAATLEHAYDAAIRRATRRLGRYLEHPEVYDRFGAEEQRAFDSARELLEVADVLPFEPDLSRAQNLCWQLLTDRRDALVERARTGDDAAERWLSNLDAIAEQLGFAPPSELTPPR
jgi:hypothetical protein